ncbi:MAG TPA: hypothetical protein VEY33_06390 [Gemmatimonadota bacterium]|nr:hypothetical protein [Gemmatimonadota bacterium]
MTKFNEEIEKNPALKKLVEMGLLHPPIREPGPLPERHPIPGLTLEQLLADLDEDRADRI